MQSYLHIISFDIPYPANYGGAIDVFHKIRCLHKQNINVILHCFEYGNKKHAIELEQLCEKVYYYPRNTSFINQLSLLPFNVKSRINKELKHNLLKDSHPILFEVLHTCYLLNDPDLKTRNKLYRHSNIEHDYFLELAKGEKSFIKKLYLKIEAFKLKRFEKQITYANCILSVSETDLNYFKEKYPNTKSIYLPSFHQFDELQCKVGKGNYILYHGNLSISENYNAVLWLLKHVFSKLSHPVIIAGLNPPAFLIKEIEKHNHISLKQNCDEDAMKTLIEDAQIHCLFTSQATGLKLKLLNVLFSGRHVLANPAMLSGTSLQKACTIVNTADEYIETINNLFSLEFTTKDIEMRKEICSKMSNTNNTKTLVELI